MSAVHTACVVRRVHATWLLHTCVWYETSLNTNFTNRTCFSNLYELHNVQKSGHVAKMRHTRTLKCASAAATNLKMRVGGTFRRADFLHLDEVRCEREAREGWLRRF